jgi:hypothetical protein
MAQAKAQRLTAKKNTNRRLTQIAAKSRLRPISPFSYVGQGHKKHKKEDGNTSRKDAKVNRE